jgi:hypothetical protein
VGLILCEALTRSRVASDIRNAVTSAPPMSAGCRLRWKRVTLERGVPARSTNI